MGSTVNLQHKAPGFNPQIWRVGFFCVKLGFLPKSKDIQPSLLETLKSSAGKSVCVNVCMCVGSAMNLHPIQDVSMGLSPTEILE